MRDPFPFSAPPALQRLIAPLATKLDLRSLPEHIHELLLATALYTLIVTIIGPAVSNYLFPDTYGRLDSRTRLNWNVHVVSLVQSTIVVAGSLWIMFCDDERNSWNWLERIHGYSPAIGLVTAFGCGYFLWDLVVTAWRVDIFGVGMLAHAISALTVFSLGWRPFLYYYSPTFLMYELSSPFLNIHWFMDKLGMTGSTPQLINGILLLSAFFGARLCFGCISSVFVFIDIYKAWRLGTLHPGMVAGTSTSLDPAVAALFRGDGGGSGKPNETLRYAVGHDVPTWLALSYLASNLVLNSLNFFWFSKMVATVRRRFAPPFGTRSERDGVNGGMDMDAQMGRSVYADGRKGVQVEATEVRKRPAVAREPTDVMSPVHA